MVNLIVKELMVKCPCPAWGRQAISETFMQAALAIAMPLASTQFEVSSDTLTHFCCVIKGELLELKERKEVEQ